MPQLDVLTIGNALIDAFLSLEDANDHVRYDRQAREFRLTAGEKIQLKECIFEIGGNASNVAVGLSRLGLQTGLMAEIGDDEFSEKIMNRLRDEDVDTSLVQRKGKSSFAMALNVKNERTLFVEHVEREHAFSLHNQSPHTIYLTSMGEKWHHVYHMVRDYKRKHEVFLVMNPGTRQLNEAPGFIREMLPSADLLFINKEEALRLTGQARGKKDMSNVLEALQMLGASTVVMTDGSQGSYVRDTDMRMFYAPTIEVPIVERTGAGDGYATGFLGALLLGKDVTEAMRWGTFSASSVIGQIGAQPGLLTRRKMHDFSEKFELEVKEVFPS